MLNTAKKIVIECKKPLNGDYGTRGEYFKGNKYTAMEITGMGSFKGIYYRLYPFGVVSKWEEISEECFNKYFIVRREK